MTIETATIRSGVAQWQVFGGEHSPTMVFLAANGFPVGSYRFLLEALASNSGVLAFESRGAWPEKMEPTSGFSWAEHADDLIAFLEYQRKQSAFAPIVGIGHSIGATVSAIAALKRPDLFRALVLIDPATVPGRVMPWAMRLMPFLAKRMDLVTRTQRRRRHWPDRNTFARYHHDKSVYRRFTDQAINDYAEAGLRENGEGFELAYSPDWEAWNFQHTALLWPVLRKLRLPILLLRAEHSYLHPDAEFRAHCRRAPANITPVTVPGAGHMLPQEAPEALLSQISRWLPTLD